MAPSGTTTFEVVKRRSWVPQDLDARLRAYAPRTHFGGLVQSCFAYLPRDLALTLLDELRIILIGESSLRVAVRRVDGTVEEWGTVSRKVITGAGVERIIGAMQGLNTIATWKYHGLGTGSTPEEVGDTTLGAELSTQYASNNTRPGGTQGVGYTSNRYQTGATVTVDASVTIQEHGVFDQALVPGGTLLDRSLTGGQALSSGDGLTCTYVFQIVSGG